MYGWSTRMTSLVMYCGCVIGEILHKCTSAQANSSAPLDLCLYLCGQGYCGVFAVQLFVVVVEIFYLQHNILALSSL